MDNKEFLDNLKTGDKLCVDGDRIGVVSKITKTMIILDSGLRFNKKTGFSTGNNLYGNHYIELLTEEKINNIKLKQINRFVVNYKYDALTQHQKIKVYELLKSFNNIEDVKNETNGNKTN